MATTWTGYYFLPAVMGSCGLEQAAGWYSCPATEGYQTEAEALQAAKKFAHGRKIKAEQHSR